MRIIDCGVDLAFVIGKPVLLRDQRVDCRHDLQVGGPHYAHLWFLECHLKSPQVDIELGG